jgi:tungstate transport system substrate-binding protein
MNNNKFQIQFILLLSAAIFITGCSKPEPKVTCKKVFGKGKTVLKLATGSPGELGLLEALANEFNLKNNTSICWVKAGSGKSLKLLKAKKVDLIMVHAPKSEKLAVKEGWAANRTLIGSNEFYIVGPKKDPAGIRKAASAADAYKKVATAKSLFLSRGDNSGTHKKEMAIWKKSGVNPSGKWYITTNDFMMATLIKANKLNGHFMTDSSTWVAGKKGLGNISVLFRGDPFLINTYHALSMAKGSGKNYDLARMFIKLLSSEKGQSLIAEYGKKRFGEAMYNNAEASKKYDH